jgi:hypothetical protein
MAKWVMTTTDEEIDAALERAKVQPEWPRIVSAAYHRDLDVMEIKVSDGRRLVFPRENLQALKGSTPEQASDFEISLHGTSIWWSKMDEGHRLENMLQGRTGNDKWMARLQQVEVAT